MGKLEDLRKEVGTYCKDKFVLFDAQGLSEDVLNNSILWNGKDYKEFLNYAEKLGSKIIYFSESEGEGEHEGQLAEIIIGFMHDGILHTYVEDASWYEPEMEEGEDTEDEDNKERNSKNTKIALDEAQETLIGEMKDYIDKAYKEDNEIINEVTLNEMIRHFWVEKGVDTWNLNPKQQLKYDKVEKTITKHYTNIIYEREDKLLTTLVDECINWLIGQGISNKRYLKKSMLKAFLSENGTELSVLGMDKLYNKVLIKMQAKP